MSPKPPDQRLDTAATPCADGVSRSSHELLSDIDRGESLLTRLRRIEGQVRGLQRMVEDERFCADILAQVAAVQASLRGATEIVLRRHLRHCVTGALRSRDPAEVEAIYAELTKLFTRYRR